MMSYDSGVLQDYREEVQDLLFNHDNEEFAIDAMREDFGDDFDEYLQKRHISYAQSALPRMEKKLAHDIVRMNDDNLDLANIERSAGNIQQIKVYEIMLVSTQDNDYRPISKHQILAIFDGLASQAKAK